MEHFEDFKNEGEITNFRDEVDKMAYDAYGTGEKGNLIMEKMDEVIYGYRKYFNGAWRNPDELIFRGNYGELMKKALKLASERTRLTVSGIEIEEVKMANGKIMYTFKMKPQQITFLYNWFVIAGELSAKEEA